MTSGSTVPVRLRGVSKRYGSTTAVSDLDLDVQPAEVLALLGPNGAGKTTPAPSKSWGWIRSPTTRGCASASA